MTHSSSASFSRPAPVPASRALAIVSLVAVIVGTFGCEDPVSEDAEIAISGEIVRSDGVPASDQPVGLYKSDLPLFTNELVLGTVADNSEPFRSTTADGDGRFGFELTGADANSSGGGSAAYFTVVAKGQTGQAVATHEFQFSDTDLTEDLGTIDLWNDWSVGLDSSGLALSWSAPRVPPKDGTYQAYVVDRWATSLTGTSATLDPRVLSRDASEATLQLVALSDERRYRAARLVVGYDPSSLQEPVDYADAAHEGRSAVTCTSSENIFELNDGVVFDIDRAANEQDGVAGFEGFEESDCFEIHLSEPTLVADVFLYNVVIRNLTGATLNVETRNGADAEWQALASYESSAENFRALFKKIADVDRTVTDLRVSVSGAETTVFETVGEIELYE